MFDGTVYPMETAVGEFRVPAIFAEKDRLNALANELDQAVEDGVKPETFITRLAKNRNATIKPEELKAAQVDLLDLYVKLKELHDHGLNGVWARIIKNGFAPVFIDPCHYVVGNPPWVNWENLPDRYRERTKVLWQQYGLFPKFQDGMRTILGSAKYDISMLFTYVAVDRYLNKGGKLGFVVSQSLFKSSGAGTGFRRFLLPDGTPIGVLVAEDMVDLHPFEGAANRTAVLILEREKLTRYPISYSVWKRLASGRGSRIPFDCQYNDVFKTRVKELEWFATPVKSKNETAPWLACRRGALDALCGKILGASPYKGREGTNTGGANAVFWIAVGAARPGGSIMISNVTERAKKKVAKTQASIESDLVYPLLRGSDINRWCARSAISILLTHREGERLKAIPARELGTDFPKAYSYLNRFENMLKARPAFKRYFKEDAPFYSIFNIGDYTFSPWKVVWREVAHDLDAAVVHTVDCAGQRKIVIPDHTCISVEVSSKEEAHYLCAILNSSPARLAIRQYIVLHPDPHVLENVNIPRFVGKNQVHQKLSGLSQRAYVAATKGETNKIKEIEVAVDKWAAKLWDLADDELAEIKMSLEETRG